MTEPKLRTTRALAASVAALLSCATPAITPPAKTANITVIGETPTDCAMMRGTSTLSATREMTKIAIVTQMTMPVPCGTASNAATICATSIPTNGIA